jgi:hypothetical protein
MTNGPPPKFNGTRDNLRHENHQVSALNQPRTQNRGPTQGDRTVGVARLHAETTGQVENCQTVLCMACVTARPSW